MISNANKAIVQKFFTELNKKNLEVIDELFSPEFTDQSPGSDSPTKTPGPAGIKKYFENYFVSFNDLTFQVNDLIAEDEKVVAYVTAHATHTGDYMGFNATNKKTEVTWAIMFQIIDGKIIRSWDILDEGTLFRQIGVECVQK